LLLYKKLQARDNDMSNQQQPIGIFDSGFGGLTVMKEIIKALPHEDIVYFGDTARLPYGSKSRETIQRFSLEIASFLMTHHIKMLVVACNTASSFALDVLSKTLPIAVIGVVTPGASAALKTTRNNRVAVIGTTGTIASGAYQKALLRRAKQCTIFAQACPLFVPLVEEGWIASRVARDVARIYLAPLKGKNIDTLILGCTHYPLLKRVIRSVMGKRVTIVDSAQETARTVVSVLSENVVLRTYPRKARYTFFVSDAPHTFAKYGKTFLGRPIASVKKVSIETNF